MTPDETAERAIDFIEDLGYPLLPWQAETLRAIMKHDGPVQVYPRPREHPRPSRCEATALTNDDHTHRCVIHLVGPGRVWTLHLCRCNYSWMANVEPGTDES